MSFTPNEPGIEKLFAEVAAKLEAVDKELRAEYTGRPASEIVEPAARAFAQIGINFTGDLTGYAQSIERNEGFRLELGG